MLLLFGSVAASSGADGKFRGLLALTLNEEGSTPEATPSKGFGGWSPPYPEDEGHRKYRHRKLEQERALKRQIELAYARLSGEPEPQETAEPLAPIAQRVAQEINAIPVIRAFGISSAEIDALIGLYIEQLEQERQLAIRLEDEIAAMLLLTAI